jgi:alanine racemase
MITVDITDLINAGHTVQVGDRAELWGKTIDVNEVAKNAGTICYDLLTGVSPRVKRKYVSD